MGEAGSARGSRVLARPSRCRLAVPLQVRVWHELGRVRIPRPRFQRRPRASHPWTRQARVGVRAAEPRGAPRPALVGAAHRGVRPRRFPGPPAASAPLRPSDARDVRARASSRELAVGHPRGVRRRDDARGHRLQPRVRIRRSRRAVSDGDAVGAALLGRTAQRAAGSGSPERWPVCSCSRAR